MELGTRADRISKEERKEVKEHLQKTLRNATVIERDEDRILTAIFLWQIDDLKYKVGQRVRITTDRESDQLKRAKAVVLGDYPRVVLFNVRNEAGQRERMQLLKADILRGRTSMEKQERKGALIVELY